MGPARARSRRHANLLAAVLPLFRPAAGAALGPDASDQRSAGTPTARLRLLSRSRTSHDDACDGAGQLREYAQEFQKSFSESPAIQAVWEAAKLNRNPNEASSFETVRNRFWQAVNAAETPEAQHVQKMLVAAGYQIRDGTLAPILAMPEYGITADNMGQRRADLVLSIDHADPRKLPPGVEVPGRGRELSPKEALDSEFLRFMPVRDNSSRGNRYDPEDKPFTGEFPKGRSHRREWMTKAALQMLERAPRCQGQLAVLAALL